MRFHVLTAAFAAALLAVACQAQGSPTYHYVFDKSEYEVPVGGTVDVAVFLEETLGQYDTSVIGPDGPGLLGGSVKLLFNDPPQAYQPARVLDDTYVSPNPVFNDPPPSVVVDSASAGMSLSTFLDLAYADRISDSVYRLPLGTFTFTAGMLAGETTPLRATDFDTSMEAFVTSDVQSLDSQIVDGAARITVVPEPSTLALLIAGGILGVGAYVRRRHAQPGL